MSGTSGPDTGAERIGVHYSSTRGYGTHKHAGLATVKPHAGRVAACGGRVARVDLAQPRRHGGRPTRGQLPEAPRKNVGLQFFYYSGPQRASEYGRFDGNRVAGGGGVGGHRGVKIVSIQNKNILVMKYQRKPFNCWCGKEKLRLEASFT